MVACAKDLGEIQHTFHLCYLSVLLKAFFFSKEFYVVFFAVILLIEVLIVSQTIV